MPEPLACEICGDEPDDGELTECECCSYQMCSSCEYEQGYCRNCWQEEHGDDDFGEEYPAPLEENEP